MKRLNIDELGEISTLLHNGWNGIPGEQVSLIPPALGEGMIRYAHVGGGIAVSSFQFTPGDDLEITFDLGYGVSSAFFVVAGGSHHRCDAIDYQFKGGEAFFMDFQGMAGVERYRAHQPMEAYGVTVPEALVEEFEPFMEKRKGRIRMIGKQALEPEMTALAREIFAPRFHGAVGALYREAKSRELLALFLSRFLPDGNREFKALALRAKALLTDNLTDAPTVSQVAREIGVNVKTLRTLFQDVYGTTPYQALVKARMETAKSLLRRGDISVQEAAWQVGYTHVGTFIAAFEKEFGERPGIYRKRYTHF